MIWTLVLRWLLNWESQAVSAQVAVDNRLSGWIQSITDGSWHHCRHVAEQQTDQTSCLWNMQCSCVADSCWAHVSDLFLSGSGFRVWMWTLWSLSTSRWTRPPRWGGARTAPTVASTPTWAPPATSRWSWPRRSRSSPNQRRRWLRRRRWGGGGGGGGWRVIESDHAVSLLQVMMLQWWPLRTPLDEPWKQTVNSEQLTCWRAAVSPVDDVTNCGLFCRFHRRSSRSRSWWPGSKSIKLNMFITTRLWLPLYSHDDLWSFARVSGQTVHSHSC